jgi:hypothetical protein
MRPAEAAKAGVAVNSTAAVSVRIVAFVSFMGFIFMH